MPISICVNRSVIWICVAIGSTVGGLAPELWGAGMLSAAGLLGSFVGALAGVWVAAKLS